MQHARNGTNACTTLYSTHHEQKMLTDTEDLLKRKTGCPFLSVAAQKCTVGSNWKLGLSRVYREETAKARHNSIVAHGLPKSDLAPILHPICK